MDSIEQTVRQTIAPYDGDLPTGAEAVVNDVINALIRRENQIAETLFNAARAQGLDSEVVRSEMEQAGIAFRQPAVAQGLGIDAAYRDEISEMIDRRVAEWKKEMGI